MDLYLSGSGDIVTSPSGDLAMTQTNWRDDGQQTLLRVLTDQGDYLLYPSMGASLSNLYGMPQKSTTGDYGIQLIKSALNREGAFTGRTISVNAIPTGFQTLRFDVNVQSGNNQPLKISVVQNLGGK